MIARTLADDLRRSAQVAPDQEALVAGERRVTYAELDELADRIAGGLIEAGVRRGDRVGVFLPNGVEACAAIYGTLRAGAAFSPLNPTTKADKLGAVLHDAGAAALICDAGLSGVAHEAATQAPSLLGVLDAAELCAGAVPARLPQVLSVDLAAVIYTSGSTGVPKGVTLTHQNMTFAAGSIGEYLELSADDRILVVSPLSFDYGLYQLLMAVRHGARLIVERGFAFPGRVVELLERESVTVLPGVPTVFGVLLGLRGLAERELPHLRALTNTGAALSAATIEGLRQTFPKARIYSMYGLTECKRVSYLPPDQVDVRPTSVGVAIPGTEVWIEDDERNQLGPGQIGELVVRGAHVMQGYWNDPEATAQRLRPGRYPWERVLATGDLFRRDEEGFLYFVGRRDDIIKSRGEKVAPREVEEVLHAHPGVRDAAVLGVADELLGQAVHAYVTPAPGVELDERELRRHCAAHLEDYMVPQRVFVRPELPKSAAGKIDRRALQATETAPA